METTISLLTPAVVITLMATILYWKKSKPLPDAKWLMENGKRVKADYVSFEIDLTVELKGKNPFVINCHWVDSTTNISYFFKSGFIWFNPGPMIKDLQSLDVYMNHNNPKKYFVDTSFLPVSF